MDLSPPREGLKAFSGVRPGRGRKPSIPPEKIAEIVEATLHEKPVGETHWSCRSMAKAKGVVAAVQRIWSARDMKPHQVRTFKLSNDKRFEEKLVDVVGLYLETAGSYVAKSSSSNEKRRSCEIGALLRSRRSVDVLREWRGRWDDQTSVTLVSSG